MAEQKRGIMRGVFGPVSSASETPVEFYDPHRPSPRNNSFEDAAKLAAAAKARDAIRHFKQICDMD